MATSLADILDRRTRAVLHDARATANAAGAVADLIGPDLGWSPERCTVEAAAYAEGVRATLTAAGLPVAGPFASAVRSTAEVGSPGEHP
jgi:glycerol-3-phosphate dehydrogenase